MNQSTGELNYHQANLGTNVNNGAKITSSYVPSVNPNQTYTPSEIAKNDEYNNQSTSVPEMFVNTRPNILPGSDIDLDYIVPPKRAKMYPGSSIDSHGNTLYSSNLRHSNKPETITSGALNNMGVNDIPHLASSWNMPTIVPQTYAPVDDKPISLKSEPIDQGLTRTTDLISSYAHTHWHNNAITDNSRATASVVNQQVNLNTPTTCTSTSDQITISSNQITISSNIPPTNSMVIAPIVSEPIQSSASSTARLSDKKTTTSVETTPKIRLTTSSSTVDYAVASTSTAVPAYDCMSCPPPVLTPEVFTNTHHKLKKTWLQRHTWAVDQGEESNDYMGPSTSTASFSQIDDIPPVLQCERRSNTRNRTNNVLDSSRRSRSLTDEPISENNEPMVIPSRNRRAHDLVNRIATRSDSDTDTAAPDVCDNDDNNDDDNDDDDNDDDDDDNNDGDDNNDDDNEDNDDNDDESNDDDDDENNDDNDDENNDDNEDNDDAAATASTSTSTRRTGAGGKKKKDKKNREKKIMVKIPLKMKIIDGAKVFFQSDPCLNVGSKIHKCRECLLFMENNKKNNTTQYEIDKIFCRFYAFRRLFTNRKGQLINSGFPDPYKDITAVIY